MASQRLSCLAARKVSCWYIPNTVNASARQYALAVAGGTVSNGGSGLSGGSVYLFSRIYWVLGLSIGRSVWFVWLVCLLVYLLVGSSVGLSVDLACLVCLVCLIGLVYLVGLVCLMVYLASLVCLLTSMLVGCLLACLLV